MAHLLHCFHRTIPSAEPKALSSHLTITYSSGPAASAPAAAAAGGDAPAADSPLGFLAALVDQLLVPAAAPDPAATDPGAALLANLVDPAALTPDAAPDTSVAPGVAAAFTKLSDALAALQKALDSGDPLDPDLLKDVTGAIDGLAALVNLPADYVAPAPSAETPALPGIAAIATHTANLGAAVSALAPDLAQKLTALGDKLNAAQLDPAILAQLTTTDDSSGTALDAIVQKLVARATAPAAEVPGLSANVALASPAVTSKTQSERTEAPAPAQPAPVAAKPAASKAGTGHGADLASKDPAPEPDADIKPPVSSNTGTAAPEPTAAATAPHAPAARIAQAAYQPVAAATALPQVAFEMVRQFQQGQNRFTIRLDPPELGRVDVKMHVDAAGTVNARLTVERAETLDLFQRDQRALERALTQAGLDGSKANLEFSLKQNPFAGMYNNQGRDQFTPDAPSFRSALGESDEALPAAPIIALYRGAATGGVNLFV